LVGERGLLRLGLVKRAEFLGGDGDDLAVAPDVERETFAGVLGDDSLHGGLHGQESALFDR
jgi:hypothetical protein